MNETERVITFTPFEVKRALGQVGMHVADVASGGGLTEREQESFSFIARFFEHLTRIAETHGRGAHILSDEAERCLWAYEPALAVAREHKKLTTPDDHGAHFFGECHLRLAELAAEGYPSGAARRVSVIYADGLQVFLNALTLRLATPAPAA